VSPVPEVGKFSQRALYQSATTACNASLFAAEQVSANEENARSDAVEGVVPLFMSKSRLQGVG
jgi:hypothetical protein